MDLVSTPLLPSGYKVPASRNEPPSKRLRKLLAEKSYVFAPGVYDPMGAELVMYHGFDAVYFSGYSFAIGHLGTTDMDLYSSVEIADGARRTIISAYLDHLEPHEPALRARDGHTAAATLRRHIEWSHSKVAGWIAEFRAINVISRVPYMA